MIDLERFIRERQDRLRGRPRSWWRDRDWRLDVDDLVDRAIAFFALANVFLGFVCVVMLMVLWALVLEQALIEAAAR